MTSRLMRFIDIGVNLTDSMFNGIYGGKEKHVSDFQQVLERSWEAGVEKMIITGGSLTDSEAAIELSKIDERLFATVGCHPTRCGEFDASGDPEAYMESLLKLIIENRDKVVAVGEIGLDFDRTQFCPIEVQKKYFEQQLVLAEKTKLPLFLHCRAARRDLCEILERKRNSFTAGVVHSFDGSSEDVPEIMKLGLHIGINGCSLKTEENLAVVKEIPVSRLMLETDAPWCGIRKTHAGYKHLTTLIKMKKKEKFELGLQVDGRNEPCNIKQVAEIVAAVKSADQDLFCDEIFANTSNVFFTSVKFDDPKFDEN
ncbi:unnamed protein product [Notodromas monacha]|uniref:Deoxyribonuclease TATDN1 n=1 Tax=Notodromas monacha TaxID=399045 RepID=A0A7R9BNF8_9CRUS|nr:unnamed protein product [Notodromas monacha]CAG0917371.1 unnamed protein product [Notodromas monacha]